MVSNDHGRTQKCGFCVSVCKTNFTDYPTPNTIYTVLEMKICSVKCTTVWYAKISSISIPSHQAMKAITMSRLDEKKPHENAFKRIKHYIYLFKSYKISIILLLKNDFRSEISKWNEFINDSYYTCDKKSSGKYKRRKKGVCNLHRCPKSWEICGCTRPF